MPTPCQTCVSKDDAELHVVLNEALNGSREKRLGAACAQILLVLPADFTHLASMVVIIISIHASRRADLQDKSDGSRMGSSFQLPPKVTDSKDRSAADKFCMMGLSAPNSTFAAAP